MSTKHAKRLGRAKVAVGARKKMQSARALGRTASRTSRLPENYITVLAELKGRVRSAQAKAATSVNRELIALYLHIGRRLAEQEAGEWGDRVVEKLAKDLRAAFPSMSGFSRTNLFYMRQVHLVWADAGRSVQQLVGQLPWGHHLVLVAKVTDALVREWYARKAVEHGWSRAVLVAQIESRLHKRAGKALTNFTATLPAPQSDLAHETLKDPYVFDFLTLGPDAQERELEQGLIDHVQRFLMELGVGFAFGGASTASSTSLPASTRTLPPSGCGRRRRGSSRTRLPSCCTTSRTRFHER